MSALPRLWSAGLALKVRSNGLAVTPKSALTDELREYIRAHKGEILTELAGMCSACAANNPGQCTRRTSAHDWSSCWARV